MDKIIKNLGGHSGCKILLIQDTNGYFVRKISSGIDYNNRLLIQAEKQKTFCSPHVRTPRVYNIGYQDDGLAFFDMEYIQGITLAKGIVTQNISQMGDIVDRIIGVFDFDTDNFSYSNANEIFSTKIGSLEKTLYNVERTSVKQAIDFLKKEDFSRVVHGKCHGDLTFENIIIKNGHLYVIDFLDSFYDSWMMDASTLLQDALMMWSYKDQEVKETNLLIKLMVFKDLLEQKLSEISAENVRQIKILLLLKLLRIYPYATEESVKNYLDKSIGNLLCQL